MSLARSFAVCLRSSIQPSSFKRSTSAAYILSHWPDSTSLRWVCVYVESAAIASYNGLVTDYLYICCELSSLRLLSTAMGPTGGLNGCMITRKSSNK